MIDLIVTYILGVVSGGGMSMVYLKRKLDKMKEGGFEQVMEESMDVMEEVMDGEDSEILGEPIQSDEDE